MLQNKKLEKDLFKNTDLMLEKPAEGDFYETVRSVCSIRTGMEILDIGCGTGVYGVDFAKNGGTVTGLDISREAVEFANKWAKKKRVNFKAVVGDAEKLPFKNEKYELVFFGAILHHFPDPQKVINEARRVLKKNGRIVLVEPNGNNPVLKISRYLAKLLPAKFAKDIHATKNETIHTRNDYCRYLLKENLYNIKVKYLKNKPSHKKTITKNIGLKIAINLKIAAMKIIAQTIPVIGYEYLLISAECIRKNN